MPWDVWGRWGRRGQFIAGPLLSKLDVGATDLFHADAALAFRVVEDVGQVFARPLTVLTRKDLHTEDRWRVYRVASMRLHLEAEMGHIEGLMEVCPSIRPPDSPGADPFKERRVDILADGGRLRLDGLERRAQAARVGEGVEAQLTAPLRRQIGW